jgi:polysaccharide export outer membrane protein
VPITTDTVPRPSLEFKPSPQDEAPIAEPVKVPVQVPPPVVGGPKVVEAPPPPGEAGPATRVVPALPEGTPLKRGKPYVLGPLDVVEVKVWNDPKLSGIFDIGTDGTISFPLVGSIVANGLTAAELMGVIRDKLTAVIIEPEVNVQVLRNNSKKYTILGGCGRTGEFPLVGEVTVLDALANCGGFKEFANLKKIYVLRGSKQLKFNYRDVIKGKNMDQNVTLENGDRIVVPDN